MLFVLAWSIRFFYPKKNYTYTELLVFTLYIYGLFDYGLPDRRLCH